MCDAHVLTDVVYFCVPELNLAFNPSDHPRASTLFLSKSHNDGRWLLYYFILHTIAYRVNNAVLILVE